MIGTAMAYRAPQNAALHDRVIQAAASRLDSTNYDVYTNPGSYKNISIGDNYPDIVLTRKGELTVQFIIEVETADSITQAEASQQWRKYATEIKASFYILVPLHSKQLAVTLCKQIGISARFGTYSLDHYGNVTDVRYE